ncbi:hypothetical protein [Micromonospora sp. NPDC005161]
MSDTTAGPALAGVTPPLPSPALGRFVAVVTAVVGTSVFGWQTVLIDAALTRQRAECIDGLRGLPAPIDVRAGTVNEESAAAVRNCLGTLHADAVRQMLVGMAVLAAALSMVGRARHRRWLISGAAALTLLGASAAAAAVHRNPGRAAATGQDGCLVGVWRLASGQYHLPVPADSPLGTMAGLRQDANVDLTSGPETGFASAYRTDGTATDLFDLAVAEGSLNGHTVRNVRRGIQTYRWTAEDGRYRQRDGVTAGDVNVVRVGARELDISSVMADSEGSYRCASDRLIIRLDADDGSWGEETFVRSGA